MFLPHKWDFIWDLHQRQLLFDSFGNDTIIIMTDFSAQYDCDPQHKLNSHQSEHAIQDVFVVCHSPSYVELENDEIKYMKRLIDNDVYHCWGSKGKKKLSNDSYYHKKCLNHIVAKYKKQNPVLKKVIIWTDGCPTQYKLRRNCITISELAKTYDVEVTHSYSPTACFKTVVDGAGKNAKEKMRRAEINEIEGARAYTPRKVYEYLKDCMGQPKKRNETTCGLNSFTKREHIYLTDIEDKQEGDDEDENVIVTNYKEEEQDCHTISGIQSIYCMQAKPTEENKVYFKDYSCYCNNCFINEEGICKYVNLTNVWKEKEIKMKGTTVQENSAEEIETLVA